MTDSELFAIADSTYSAADFEDAQFPERVVLKLVLPKHTRVSSDLRATLMSAWALP